MGAPYRPIDIHAEIENLTGRRPSRPYNHEKNVKNQEEITRLSVEALNKGYTSYGKYVAAQQYLEQTKIIRKW